MEVRRGRSTRRVKEARRRVGERRKKNGAPGKKSPSADAGEGGAGRNSLSVGTPGGPKKALRRTKYHGKEGGGVIADSVFPDWACEGRPLAWS